MNAAPADYRKLGKQALACALAFGIWFAPIPAGLTKEAWHLFAVFAAAIFAVIVNAFPLLTASLLAAGAVVLTDTVDPAKAFAGFANSSVLLVVIAFLVANAVVKSGLGRRISLLVVSACGRSTLGLLCPTAKNGIKSCIFLPSGYEVCTECASAMHVLFSEFCMDPPHGRQFERPRKRGR